MQKGGQKFHFKFDLFDDRIKYKKQSMPWGGKEIEQENKESFM